MDDRTRLTILELEKQKDALAARYTNLEARMREVDFEAIEVYKEENARFAEALQEIADGKGKYAGIAKAALAQKRE